MILSISIEPFTSDNISKFYLQKQDEEDSREATKLAEQVVTGQGKVIWNPFQVLICIWRLTIQSLDT